jgi:hypothetical protein
MDTYGMVVAVVAITLGLIAVMMRERWNIADSGIEAFGFACFGSLILGPAWLIAWGITSVWGA